MKKFSKIRTTNSIFISTSILILLSQIKTANASPGYSKPPTIALLSEVVRNPLCASIQKSSEGKLTGRFIHSGSPTRTLHNFSIKAESIVMEKTNENKFRSLVPSFRQRKMISTASSFRILTSSKNNLNKEINIFRDGENIVVTSVKGEGTSQHVSKKTVLNFENKDIDGPSTSTQTHNESSKPTITVTRYSISNGQSKKFDTKTTNMYDARTLKLLSNVTKVKSEDGLETITQYGDGTKFKIVNHNDGRESSFMYNHRGETLFSNEPKADKTRIVVTKLNNDTYSKSKYGANQKLMNVSKINPTSSEIETFDDYGNLTSITTKSILSNGESIETMSNSNGYTTQYKRRHDGSLSSLITHTPSGELLKQDFDLNNTPINSPYPYTIN